MRGLTFGAVILAGSVAAFACGSFSAAPAPKANVKDAGIDNVPPPNGSTSPLDNGGVPTADCDASFCEHFSDDKLEARGWERTNATAGPDTFTSKVSGTNVSFLERSVVGAGQTATPRFSVEVTIQLVDPPCRGLIDLFMLHRAGNKDGFFISRDEGGLYVDATNPQPNGAGDEFLFQAITGTFAAPTRITITVDTTTHKARYQSGTDDISLDLVPELAPATTQLLIGIGTHEESSACNAVYDDIVIRLLP